MAELNQQQVIDYIKGISVLELSQLVKALESELGVSAFQSLKRDASYGKGLLLALLRGLLRCRLGRGLLRRRFGGRR